MEDRGHPFLGIGLVVGRGGGAGMALQDLGLFIPLLGDRLVVQAQLLGDLQPGDLAREDGRGGLGYLLGIARGKDLQTGLLGLPDELVDRAQAHRDEQGVAGVGLFRARNGLEVLIDPRNGDRLQVLLAVGRDNGVAGIDRHPQAPYLVLVDLVTAAFLQGLHQPGHLYPGLEGVVGRDQAHIPAAGDKKPLGRSDPVAVDQGLEGPGAVHSGQGVARKGQGFLPGPGGHQDHLGVDDPVALAPDEHAHLFVGKDIHGRGIQPDPDRTEPADLLLQNPGDVETPGPGVAVFYGSEELVGLQKKLAAQAVLVVHDQGLDTPAAQLGRGGQARRSAADNQNIRIIGPAPARLGRGLDLRQTGQPLHRLHDHALLDLDHAGFHRNPVGDDRALGALAVGAEDALGRAVLGMVPEDVDTVGEKGGGDNLSPAARKFLFTEVKRDFFPFLDC